MNDDWLRQWQAFMAACAGNAGSFGGTMPFGASASPPWPFATASTQPASPGAGATDFATAWLAALERTRRGNAERSAGIEQFSEFLRATFGNPSAFAALGPQMEQMQHAERLAAASARMQDAQARLTQLWGDALRDAAEAFARLCFDPAAAARPATELYDAWIDCAEDAYGRIAHGEAYCTALA